MGFFKTLFGKAGDTGREDPRRNAWFPQTFVPEDMRLTPEETLSVSAVYGCVRVISEALASSPWDVYQREGEKRLELPDDPVQYILNVRPNPETTAQAFKEALVIQALATGNGFAEIVRDMAGRVKEMWLIQSERVQVQRARGGEPIECLPPRQAEPGEIVYWVMQPANLPSVQPLRIYLGADQVYHLRALASIGQLMGDSPVGRAAKAVAVAHAADRFALNYFGNGAHVGGVLKLNNIPKTPEEENALREKWDTQRTGVRNAFTTVFIGPGNEYEPFKVDLGSSQNLENRQFSIEEIARYFGVPIHLLSVTAGSQGYGRNLDVLGLEFVRYGLRGWKNRLEQEANYKLFPQRAPWKFTEVDLSELTHGDFKTRADAFDIYLKNGTLCVNEVREELGYNDIGPDGDEYGPQVTADASGSAGDAGQVDTKAEDDASPDVTPGDGMSNLFQLILSKHKGRLVSREAELSKTLKNGVLQEKLQHAQSWSREQSNKELMQAGVGAPPGWLEAVEMVEAGADPGDVAIGLTRERN